MVLRIELRTSRVLGPTEVCLQSLVFFCSFVGSFVGFGGKFTHILDGFFFFFLLKYFHLFNLKVVLDLLIFIL